ncbi:BQ2448_1373 [Microbotryum intermedium]|uniref:Peroxidase n=1 Tax=Microbotryum intermedium TaxID=269621 RepID=A0A238FB24_9BASI|nr:BQ2448_1373 [Microbotryum intermedium]
MSFATRSLLRSSRFVAPRLAVRQPALARRTYATAAPASGGSNTTLFALLGAAALGGGAYYALRGQSDSDPTKVKDAASPQKVDYQKVYDAIAQVLEAEDYDDGSYGPVLVRLAWHASGTFDKTTGSGGSNGATMRFAPEANHGANAGLDVARNLLEPIKKQFPEITYSDLWTLAGVCAIQEMGGPTIPWRAGRKDGNVENCTPDGRLPDGDKGSDHLRHVFYRMGFNDQEIVALSGAHAVGRCHTDRSGFSGPWQHSPTSFNNEYYKLLLNEKWQPKPWKGPFQYEDKSTKNLMMLTTDMALATDKAFRPYAEQYAKDESKFFADFSKVFAKLIELGVPEKQLSEPIKLRPTGSE